MNNRKRMARIKTKLKRKQCTKCLRTFYKPHPIDAWFGDHIYEVNTCPHCDSASYIIV